MAEMRPYDAVLFDLDGTLADTAPDLGGTVNRLLVEEGRPPLPLSALRPYVSQGVRGLLKAGFGLHPDDAAFAPLSDRFLAIYAAHICDESRLFDGMSALLAQIEGAGMRWGIVTNKRSRFTAPVVAGLGLTGRAGSVVSGDTTAEAKPSPLPVLHACAELGVAPQRTLFVGDDQRDVAAGRAAGCLTVGVRWGYLGDGGPIETWGADLLVDTPDELADFLSRRTAPTA